MSASPEFIQICRAQFEILSSGLGASLCIVYVTDTMSEERDSTLVPVVVYPEHLMPWAETELLSWLQYGQHQDTPPVLPNMASGFEGEESGVSTMTSPLSSEPQSSESNPFTDQRSVSLGQYSHGEFSSSFSAKPFDTADLPDSQKTESMPPSAIAQGQKQGRRQNQEHDQVHDADFAALSLAPVISDLSFPQQHQIALPLVYEGIMVGFLVTGRPDRFWTDQEHHQIEQIAKTIGISRVVDQRERWLEERVKTRTQHQLSAAQHDVFDDLIHQFRNPLTALRTFGKLLMRRLSSSDRNFGVAESIVRESDRLQDLLQYFKSALDEQTPQIADGTMSHPPRALLPQSDHQRQDSASASESSVPIREEELSLRPESVTETPVIDVSSSAAYLTGHEPMAVRCELSDVLAPLIDVAWAIAEDQELTLSIEIAPEVSSVQADPKGLQEVLSNLIDNAVKYTPSGGRVLIRVPAPHPDKQAIIVADTGLGIPETDQIHLFERHFRGVQEAGNIPGTGLGLAIARDLIEKMGGTISVVSPVSNAPYLSDWVSGDSIHPGTAFIVWLNRTT